jgi:hypothetical protein
MASGRVGWLFGQSTELATHIRHKRVTLNEPKTLSNDTEREVPKLDVTNVTLSVGSSRIMWWQSRHYKRNIYTVVTRYPQPRSWKQVAPLEVEVQRGPLGGEPPHYKQLQTYVWTEVHQQQDCREEWRGWFWPTSRRFLINVSARF